MDVDLFCFIFNLFGTKPALGRLNKRTKFDLVSCSPHLAYNLQPLARGFFFALISCSPHKRRCNDSGQSIMRGCIGETLNLLISAWPSLPIQSSLTGIG